MESLLKQVQSSPGKSAVALAGLYGLYRVAQSVLGGVATDLKGKIVLVTGAASGVGRELSQELALAGASLILVDIQKDALEKTVEIVQNGCLQSGQTVETYICNLADRENIYSMAEKILDRTESRGGVDVVINNAGIVTGIPFLESEDVKNELTMQINCLAHMWMAKAFLPSMIRRGTGNFVNIVSIASRIAAPSMVDYACSKAAALSFSEGISLELKQQGIKNVHITCVCPTHIATPMFEGFDAHGGPAKVGYTLSARGVARSTVRAIKQNAELVWLPGILRSILAFKAINEIRGVLGFQSSFSSSHNPMQNWKAGHTDGVWAKVQSKM